MSLKNYEIKVSQRFDIQEEYVVIKEEDNSEPLDRQSVNVSDSHPSLSKNMNEKHEKINKLKAKQHISAHQRSR